MQRYWRICLPTWLLLVRKRIPGTIPRHLQVCTPGQFVHRVGAEAGSQSREEAELLDRLRAGGGHILNILNILNVLFAARLPAPGARARVAGALAACLA